MNEASSAPSQATLPSDPPAEWDDIAPAPAPLSADQILAPALVIGIIGDSGSGKKTVADAVEGLLGADRCTDILLDDYHRYTRAERAELGLTPSTPLVHDLDLMREHLSLLRQRTPIYNRSYDHSDGTFGPVRRIEARDIVVVHGLLGFPQPELKQLYDLAVFLNPEPDLLFRWKLRRDVNFRGYSEAEVLKRIAAHVLDAKEFVLPQAAYADLIVDYRLPDWDAPDAQVLTTIRLREPLAEMARSSGLFDGLPVEPVAEGAELVVDVPADIAAETVECWAASRFPGGYDQSLTGQYFDETGVLQKRSSLAVVEGVIASLAAMMLADRQR